jgi:predicted permease
MPMINELFSVVAPIFICAGAGYAWAYKGIAYPVDFVTRLVMNVGAPCLILASFGNSSLEMGNITEIALAALVVLAIVGLTGILLLKMLRLDTGTFLPSLLFPNIGNMGLPLCLFAFGDTGLALALTIFLLVFTLQMSLGIALVAGRGNVRELTRQPVLWATLMALVMIGMDWSLPTWLYNTTNLLGDLTIPMMLITLGVSLARLKVAEWKHSLLFSLVRVLGGFLVALLVAGWFGFEGVERGVLIVQSSMPAAVFNYLLALRFERQPGEVAGMVLLSTLLSFICLPFIVAFLLD